MVVARSDCQSFSARAWAGVNYPVCFNDGLQKLLASPVVASAVVLFAAAAAERYADRDWEWRETQEEPTACHSLGCREAWFLLTEVIHKIRMAKCGSAVRTVVRTRVNSGFALGQQNGFPR
jgi:hypothetical protein